MLAKLVDTLRARVQGKYSYGSGKTPLAIGSFTAAASDPSTGVKRGIFVVPSSVQGQFHGEMAQFITPGSGFHWHATPGASADERFAAHRDPHTNMVVMTHQGFRDDMLRCLQGVAPHGMTSTDGKLRDWFMGLPRKERAAVVAQAWKVNGINYQASFLDEGHVTLDRRGKPDSLLSAMMTAVSDNTPYYMAMTADPAKNDISEIRSQLDKLYPDGRYGSEEQWHKRYGLNTSASRDALRREVDSKFFTQEISPPTKMRPAERTVELHPWQQAEYEKITQNFDKARAAMSRGEVAADAIKALRPERFDGVQPADSAIDCICLIGHT